MSRFRPAPFGRAAVNTVTGELQISGSVVISGTDTITGNAHTLDTDASVALIKTTLEGACTLMLPAPDAVPVGWTMTFKDVGPMGIGDSFRFRCPVAGQTIDGNAAITFSTAAPNQSRFSLTLRNTGVDPGTTWAIMNYYSGSIV